MAELERRRSGAFRLRDGAPLGVIVPPPDSELTPAFGQRGAIFYYDPHPTYPYTMNFNLTLQHQWKGTLFEVAYFGDLGRHAPGYAVNRNRIPPSLLSRTDIPERLKRPFTVFAGSAPNVTDAEPRWRISNYNAFTLRLERRFHNGLSYTLAYTFSKLIDDIDVQTAFASTWGDNNGRRTFTTGAMSGRNPRSAFRNAGGGAGVRTAGRKRPALAESGRSSELPCGRLVDFNGRRATVGCALRPPCVEWGAGSAGGSIFTPAAQSDWRSKLSQQGTARGGCARAPVAEFGLVRSPGAVHARESVPHASGYPDARHRELRHGDCEELSF